MSDPDKVLPAVWHEVKSPAVLKTPEGKEIRYIGPDEAKKIISLLKGRDQLLIETLWNTGARVSEILELTPSSFNFNESTVTIRSLKKKKRLPKEAKDIKNEIRGLELAINEDPNSKILRKKLENAKKRLETFNEQHPPKMYRIIPLRAEFCGKVAGYCMENNIRPRQKLFPITRVRVYQIIQKAGEQAGIEKDRRHPHVFRHGFAVNAVLSGVPPLVLRRWLGHARIETTLIYTEVLAQDTRVYLENMKF